VVVAGTVAWEAPRDGCAPTYERMAYPAAALAGGVLSPQPRQLQQHLATAAPAATHAAAALAASSAAAAAAAPAPPTSSAAAREWPSQPSRVQPPPQPGLASAARAALVVPSWGSCSGGGSAASRDACSPGRGNICPSSTISLRSPRAPHLPGATTTGSVRVADIAVLVRPPAGPSSCGSASTQPLGATAVSSAGGSDTAAGAAGSPSHGGGGLQAAVAATVAAQTSRRTVSPASPSPPRAPAASQQCEGTSPMKYPAVVPPPFPVQRHQASSRATWPPRLVKQDLGGVVERMAAVAATVEAAAVAPAPDGGTLSRGRLGNCSLEPVAAPSAARPPAQAAAAPPPRQAPTTSSPSTRQLPTASGGAAESPPASPSPPWPPAAATAAAAAGAPCPTPAAPGEQPPPATAPVLAPAPAPASAAVALAPQAAPAPQAAAPAPAPQYTVESEPPGIPASGAFACTDPRLLQLFFGTSKQRIAVPGEVFFAKGERDDQLFILSQGDVEVRRDALPGHKPFVRVLRGPSYFGEACALGLRQYRTATVRAQTVCEVRVLLGEAFRGFLRCFPNDQQRFLEEAHARLAALAIWEGVSRKRCTAGLRARAGSPVPGSTTSWSQESSVQVSRQRSMSNSTYRNLPSGSQASSVPVSRHGSKSPRDSGTPRLGGCGGGGAPKPTEAIQEHTLQHPSHVDVGPGIPWEALREHLRQRGRQTLPADVGRRGGGGAGGTARPEVARVGGGGGGGWFSPGARGHAKGTAAAAASSAGGGAGGAQEGKGGDRRQAPRYLQGPSAARGAGAAAAAGEDNRSGSPLTGGGGGGGVLLGLGNLTGLEPPKGTLPSPEDVAPPIQGREARHGRPGRSREDTPQSSPREQPGKHREDIEEGTSAASKGGLRGVAQKNRKVAELSPSPCESPREEGGLRYSTSEGPLMSCSPASPDQRSPKEACTPQRSQKTLLGRRQRHKPPKPREGWQISTCRNVVINYPSALPSKNTFVQRKVPRPVSPEASSGGNSSRERSTDTSVPPQESGAGARERWQRDAVPEEGRCPDCGGTSLEVCTEPQEEPPISAGGGGGGRGEPPAPLPPAPPGQQPGSQSGCCLLAAGAINSPALIFSPRRPGGGGGGGTASVPKLSLGPREGVVDGAPPASPPPPQEAAAPPPDGEAAGPPVPGRGAKVEDCSPPSPR